MAGPTASKGLGRFSADRQKLLRLVLADKGVRAPEREVIAPRDRQGENTAPPPLSFAQQRLWLLDRLEPGSAFYNVPLAVRLEGALDLPALLASLVRIVQRHEALRTTFDEEEGRPFQTISEEPRPEIGVADLSSLPLEARTAEAARLVPLEASRPFDLQRGPLIRAVVLRLGGSEHVTLVTMHHIVSDGWSCGVLLRETAALYDAASRGLPPPLPPLPIQYADFAAWQRERLAGPVMDEQLRWWRERLTGTPEALDLPTDHPRPAAPSFRGARRPVVLPAALSDRLRALALQEDATLFMVLLAAFGALLGRMSGQGDVVLGTPIANRHRAEIEGLIGFFVNTLALRVDASRNPGFRELLRQVRETAHGAYAHQDLPFERLVEELHPERATGRNPLFQVMFALQNTPVPRLEVSGGLTMEPLPAETGTAKFDLSLFLSEIDGRIAGELEYAAELFDPPAIDRTASHLERFLEEALADLEAPVAELPLLTEAERHQLLIEWSDTEPAEPHREELLHELFEAQATQTPGAVALISGEERWTYRELDQRAEEVADQLRALSVGSDDRVAISLPRTPEMIAAILGVLKAGGAYVPVDPNYPEARRRMILADAGAVVTLPLVGAGSGGWGNGKPALGGGTLAYLIYTSGSTGEPKGVAITHRSAVALVRWARTVFSAEELSRVLAATSINFDLSVFEIFVPLATGGAVVLAADALALPRLPAAGEVTLVNTVPSAMSELARAGALPPSVRTVNLAGEPLPRELADALYEIPGVRRVWNLYGPSEDTTYSTFARIERGDPRAPGIGRPVTGTLVRLLDRSFQPAPIGIPGELCLGGDGLARGYLGRPALTAERWVPDPFPSESGARIYRTGDLARFRPDGALEFLGRIDHQVKVRGFRIEPGEIETALRALPGVHDAAVLALGEGAERRLAAFVAGEGLAASDLREALRGRLPEHMIPARFAVLDALPLTPNGKIDRRALARLDHVEARPLETRSLPQGPVEEMLAETFGEVLGVQGVGAGDHFFELGGHSLLAMRALSRVRSILGVDLPLRAMFEAPTVEALARRIDEARGTGLRTEAAPIRPVPRDRPLPLSFAQERMWFLDRLAPGSPIYNIPGVARFQGELRHDLLARALVEMGRRHESLRTRFGTAQDGRPIQVIEPEPAFASNTPLPLIDLSPLPEQARLREARRVAERESLRPFDLARGPVLRAALLHLGTEDHVTVLTRHHIVADGWSMELFTREISAIYVALRDGQPSPLPPPPIQYADFAAWQREHLSGVRLEPQIEYWRRTLAGAPPLLQLPADRPRPPVQTFRGEIRTLELDAPALQALRAAARGQGGTLFMLLLTTFEALIQRYTGRDDLLIGTPVANRHRPELETLMGFLANTLVLRTDLGGDPSFREALARVRRTALEAYENQDVPFERVVEELKPKRDLSHSPIFQVMFVQQAEHQRVEETSSLQEAALGSLEAVSRFDFELYAIESPSGLLLAAEYNVDLFDRVRIDRALGHLRTLLDAAVVDPDRHLSDLPLLTEVERHQLLIEQIGDLKAPEKDGTLLHELFEAQAARTPEATALIGGEVRWTYRELDERAETVAAELRGQGIGPEDRVGVSLPRTPEMVAALLGVLKAGAAYVPVDPNYPEARRARILADAAPRLILNAGRVSHAPDRPNPPLREAKPRKEALAYLIYTSGSTGEPKGVAIPHTAAVALVRWAGEVFSRDDLSGVLAATSINFDLSVFEIFVPLSRGGTVILAENALELPRLLAAGEVTLVNTVPSAMDALVRTGGVPPSVRVVNLAGEALTRELADRIQALPHVERLYDLYGPSEDTTYSTFSLVPRGESRPPAIGKPIAGTRAMVVDRRLRPAPLGIPGELCLAGAGLARGYLGKPAATAEKWVPDPFGELPGERMYRTGDLVRRRADGELEFLGRIDHQLKVRGFRVEAGEIETLLRGAPGVEEVVVGAWKDASGDARLVAWIAGEEIAPETLREHLRERLPEPLIPSFFVPLRQLPRTATGKVDRGALPDPTRGGVREETVWVAPRTPLEQTVADLWSELLGRRIGLQEDFFHLGGNSLLAAQYIARLRDALGVDLPVRAVFEAPTVAGQARRILAGRLALEGSIPSWPSEGDAPLSFAQERMWFLQRLAPEGAYHIPAALRLLGTLRVEALESALREIVRRHAALRTVFPEVGGRPVQRVLPEAGLDLTRIDLAGLSVEIRENELRQVAGAIASAPLALETRPPLRAALIRLGSEEHVLAVTPHHIVFDGWSIGVFVSELAALYRGASDLPPLPIQYVDWARWQRERLEGVALAEALSWWRSWLGTDLPVLDLPTDHPRPPVPSQRGAALHLDLPADLTAQIRTLGRERRASLFMTLLAGFQLLLHRLTGQETVIVGTPVAGRERTEVEGLIGLFVNTLALRSDRAAGEEGFGGWLAGTRERVLDAWAHQEVPFERLVEELQPRRSLAHTPVFQALFVLQNAPLPPLDLPGLHLEPLDVETGRAPFDLSLDLVETGNGLRASWLYAENLFEPETVARFADSYRTLLAAALAEPDRPLAELPILAEAERHAVVAPAASCKAAWEAPRILAEMLLAGIWTELLGVEKPGRHDGFFDLGGHSLLAVLLLSRIQESCGVELVLRDVFAHPTLASLARRIEELVSEAPGGETQPWSPLVPLVSGNEGEAPLFCIHGGGGSVLVFADLARALGGNLPVYGLEARGLSAGQTPLDRIEAMADLYLRAIHEVQPRGPYRLLGYSIGGKVAFEIARRLEGAGEPVELLAILDIPALVPEEADEVFEAELAAEVADLPHLDPESVRRHLAVWRASWEASRSWAPGLYNGRILLVVAEEGGHPQQEDPMLGWSACSAGGVEVVTVPGGHFTLLPPPHVEALTASLHHLVR